tara:strand:+ start:374 stop:565 length:192 start_codon:yes stop_codon:yes gene_type:complete
MEIKLYMKIILYFSKNRLNGYGIMYFSMAYALFHALFKDGASGGFGDVIHLPFNTSKGKGLYC